MRKIVNASALILSGLVVIAIIWVGLLLFVLTGVHQYVPDPIFSDDGQTVIVPTINYSKDELSTYLCVNIEVRDIPSGKISYQVQTHASDRLKWSIYWAAKDVFRLDSADIGSYCWKEEGDSWGEIDCP